MIDKIKENKEKLQLEYDNTIKALKIVQEQIQIYKKKAEELTSHLNYTKGARDILEDILEGEENV